MNCDNQQKNRQNCNCTYEPCSRKGKCCECILYHKRMNELPACFFSDRAEQSYDRSRAAFIRDNK